MYIYIFYSDGCRPLYYILYDIVHNINTITGHNKLLEKFEQNYRGSDDDGIIFFPKHQFRTVQLPSAVAPRVLQRYLCMHNIILVNSS